MNKITTVLFDFDGVIADTEPQYDMFFDGLAEKCNLGIEHFASKVKGVTMPNIVKKYFSDFTPEQIEDINKEVADFEVNMDFKPIGGSLEFIQYLKDKGYKVGLVTSSRDFKMKVALEAMNLTGKFDTEVTANRITDGKPNPMCYLLAAKDLGVDPAACVVFEDSIFGIASGYSAGMRVIGLATTLSADQIAKNTHSVISDFSDVESVMALLK